jgi:hypothetical protein
MESHLTLVPPAHSSPPDRVSQCRPHEVPGRDPSGRRCDRTLARGRPGRSAPHVPGHGDVLGHANQDRHSARRQLQNGSARCAGVRSRVAAPPLAMFPGPRPIRPRGRPDRRVLMRLGRASWGRAAMAARVPRDNPTLARRPRRRQEIVTIRRKRWIPWPVGRPPSTARYGGWSIETPVPVDADGSGSSAWSPSWSLRSE